MLARLFLLFTIVPAVELYLLLNIKDVIGPLGTVGLVLGTGALGAWMARREGLSVLRQIREEAAAGRVPGDTLLEGVLVLLGGIMLVTPGVLTDLCGLALIVPLTRRPFARALKSHFAGRIQVGGLSVGPVAPGPAARKVRDHFDHPVA